VVEYKGKITKLEKVRANSQEKSTSSEKKKRLLGFGVSKRPRGRSRGKSEGRRCGETAPLIRKDEGVVQTEGRV